MARDDISENLVHWTKGETDEIAFNTLRKILLEENLIGGTGYITGKHRCVCFTETPSKFFHNQNATYLPFGIEFSKEDIYKLGGRPVIYQSTKELALLDKEIEWRHVQYRPFAPGRVDFTWEREWRLKTDNLAVPVTATVYVKNKEFARRLHDDIESVYFAQAHHESAMIGNDWPSPAPVQFNIQAID